MGRKGGVTDIEREEKGEREKERGETGCGGMDGKYGGEIQESSRI